MTGLDLEAVKARAAEPAKVLEWASHYADEYIGALTESQNDVEKLVAVLEKIRDTMTEWADRYEAISEQLWELVRNRDPGHDLEAAKRHSSYAASYRAAADVIDRTIEEGPTP